MEWDIIFQNNYVKIILKGEADYEGLRNYVREVVENPEWKPGLKTLTDFRQLNIDFIRDLSRQQSWMYMLGSFRDKLGHVRNASVINETDLDVYIRMVDNLRQIMRIPIEGETFTDEAEALRWLLEEE